MRAARERKRNPHHCVDCGADFEVAYFDDRTGDRAALAPVTVDVSCPECGKAKPVSLPAGAERALVVELAQGEAEEGGGG